MPGKHEGSRHVDPDPTEDIVDGVLFGPLSTYQSKWQEMGPEDSPLVRGALLRAEQMERAGLGGRDAYLAGFSDMRAIMARLMMVREVAGQIADNDTPAKLTHPPIED